MNRGQVAAKVREQKEKHPERYCSVKNCLWNTSHSPCQKHPLAPIQMGRIIVDDHELDGNFSLPEVGE